MTLLYIVIASLAGGIASALLAASLAWRIQPRLIPLFVSFAVGALLGVVFLDMLPHIFERSRQFHVSAAWILAGILGFFVLEKLVLWRHDHDHAGQAEAAMAQGAHDHAHHGHDHAHVKPAGAWMIIIGDGFHNFTDGFAIAAAFTADTRLGVITALALIAHELPQELGEFLVLVHSGFSRAKALMWNLLSSLATLAGALIGYFALGALAEHALVFLCIAAASMIYVAIADLIPGLHKRTSFKESLAQIVLIAAGVAAIGVFHRFMVH